MDKTTKWKLNYVKLFLKNSGGMASRKKRRGGGGVMRMRENKQIQDFDGET